MSVSLPVVCVMCRCVSGRVRARPSDGHDQVPTAGHPMVSCPGSSASGAANSSSVRMPELVQLAELLERGHRGVHGVDRRRRRGSRRGPPPGSRQTLLIGRLLVDGRLLLHLVHLLLAAVMRHGSTGHHPSAPTAPTTSHHLRPPSARVGWACPNQTAPSASAMARVCGASDGRGLDRVEGDDAPPRRAAHPTNRGIRGGSALRMRPHPTGSRQRSRRSRRRASGIGRSSHARPHSPGRSSRFSTPTAPTGWATCTPIDPRTTPPRTPRQTCRRRVSWLPDGGLRTSIRPSAGPMMVRVPSGRTVPGSSSRTLGGPRLPTQRRTDR